MVLGQEVSNDIPADDAFYELYEADNHKLHFDIETGKENMNTKEYLNDIVKKVTEHLRESEIRPSIAFHHVPKAFLPEITADIEWRMID